jgi:hypothetical protein
MESRYSLPGDDIPQDVWRTSYFNYFTEVEEHFQRARGTALFLLSPIDWALVESWKNAGVPLEAVLRGIDKAFEKWRSRKTKARVREINSLTYCAQAVMEEAQAMEGVVREKQAPDSAAPFEEQELKGYLLRNAGELRARDEESYGGIAQSLEAIAGRIEEHGRDLEELEQRLTSLEEKLIATARARQSDEEIFRHRRELDLQLKPHRRAMSAPQLAMLEKQFLERKLLEAARLPRLSLFYMR